MNGLSSQFPVSLVSNHSFSLVLHWIYTYSCLGAQAGPFWAQAYTGEEWALGSGRLRGAGKKDVQLFPQTTKRIHTLKYPTANSEGLRNPWTDA